jgi:hypothetical protein
VLRDEHLGRNAGRKKLKVDWTAGESAVFTSERLKKTKVDPGHQPQKVVRNVGDVDASSLPEEKLRSQSTTLSCVSMEPPVAVAEYRDGMRPL